MIGNGGRAPERRPESVDLGDDRVRESMAVLPRVLQLPLTLLTGKPLNGQQPLRWSPGFHVFAAYMNLAIGVALSCLGFLMGGPGLLLLLPGWAVTLHGQRNLRMLIFHQCSHRNLYGRRWLDIAIGYSISSLLIVQNYRTYSREHVSDHHAVHHMTLRDPTVQAILIGLDLHPGMSRQRMWRRVMGKLVSPKFHIAFLMSRIGAFARGSSPTEKVTALLIYGTGCTVSTMWRWWPMALVVWCVPLVPFYQVSNTLRLCVKHTFPSAGAADRRGKHYFAGLTNAIFLGETVPSRSTSRARLALAWSRWGLRMAFIHFPFRYLVLTGDTVVHDYHHRYPASRQWHNYLFARHEDSHDLHSGWPPYTAAWGFKAAVNRVFDTLSVADPDEYDVVKLKSAGRNRRDHFTAFDD